MEIKFSISGLGWLAVLLFTVLFVALKLTNYIAWSWLWVLSPVWLPIAVIIAILIAAYLIATLIRVYDNWSKTRRDRSRYGF